MKFALVLRIVTIDGKATVGKLSFDTMDECWEEVRVAARAFGDVNVEVLFIGAEGSIRGETRGAPKGG